MNSSGSSDTSQAFFCLPPLTYKRTRFCCRSHFRAKLWRCSKFLGKEPKRLGTYFIHVSLSVAILIKPRVGHAEQEGNEVLHLDAVLCHQIAI